MNAPLLSNIGLVGYGEVGRILAEDLRARGVSVSAFDVKLAADPRVNAGAAALRVNIEATALRTNAEAEAAALRDHAEAHGVTLAGSHAALAAGAELIVSAVTASQAVPVAAACAPALRPGTWLLDVNSASPGAKIAAARLVDGAGGRYVEGAVMTSVPPYRIAVPLLLGGPNAAALQPLLAALGFAPKVASAALGVASATKMCRSVVIKGFEAMLIEGLTAARHYGVEAQVLASLAETFPGIDWEKQGAYFFQRVIEHGRRRSEEVREVAVTVADAGLTPWSATATAERQGWVADLADAGVFSARGTPGFARSADWRVEADRILAALPLASH